MNAPEPSSPPISNQVLGRPPWTLDVRAHRDTLEGRRVVVTGAAGSIGRALATHVAQLAPARLLLVDSRPFDAHDLDCPVRAIRADLRLAEGLDAVPWDEVDVVFHAAALKHLAPLERDPFAAVETNVLATAALLDRLEAGDVRARFTLVSSDKAADPTSMLGVSKLLAERLVASRGGTSVRLANVLDSDGSLAPRVRRALRLDRPVTMRDPDATRLVMTIDETVAAVVEASALGRRGDTLVPRDLRPVRVADLIAWAAGGAPYDVRRTRLKPGEKRHEVLVSRDEDTEDVSPRLARVVRGMPVPPVDIADLHQAVDARDGAQLATLLTAMVPGWRPSRACSAALGSEIR